MKPIEEIKEIVAFEKSKVKEKEHETHILHKCLRLGRCPDCGGKTTYREEENSFINMIFTGNNQWVEIFTCENGHIHQIKHPSYVSFRNTRIDMASHLEKMASDQSAFPQVDTSLELLTKIRSGILASKQTPNFYKLLLTP